MEMKPVFSKVVTCEFQTVQVLDFLYQNVQTCLLLREQEKKTRTVRKSDYTPAVALVIYMAL